MNTQIERLAQGLPAGMDAALIFSDVNRRYYSGFQSSAGTLLVSKEYSWLIIDSRYYGAAVKQAGADKVILQDKLYEQLAALLRENGLKTLGIEASRVTLTEHRELEKKLPEAELIADGELDKLIAAHRRSKTDGELAAMREAQRITDEAFTHILEWLRPGMTEREIALELEFYTRDKGSEGASFSYIVAAGENSAVPHHVPGDYAIRQGDFITMDFGCLVDGYCSDMTRTVALGEPGPKKREVYELVLKAQLAAIAAIRAGVVCKEIDRVAREIIDATEYKGRFGHGLGHSIGLEVHEPPRFAPGWDDLLPERCVISVEPGIYLAGEFGVRIEDLVVPEKDGCEILGKSPKELILL